MGEYEIGRMVYLVLLGGVLLVYLLVSNRRNLGTMLRQSILWALIFIGVVLAYGMWEDMSRTVAPRQTVIAGEGRVEVPRAADGHYYMILEIQGADIRFMVDTGATDMVLSRPDARRAGFDPDRLSYGGIARTANGTVRTARVTLDSVRLNGIVDREVTAWVNEGEMDISLLGMAYLQRYARIEIEGNRLILTR